MVKNKHDGFSALELLQSKLNASSHLEVIHDRADCWNAYFSFGPPAKVEDLEQIKIKWHLPQTYEQFLLHYDGAMLYKDDINGQWGFQLYSTNELISKNTLWEHAYRGYWSSSYLVFAESLGDADSLLLYTEQHSPNSGESYVLDGDSSCLVSTWQVIAHSFGQWLDLLVVAQGTKYWRWPPYK